MYNKITTMSSKFSQYTFILKGKSILYIGMRPIGSKGSYSWRKEKVKSPNDVWERIGLCATTLECSVCDLFYD